MKKNNFAFCILLPVLLFGCAELKTIPIRVYHASFTLDQPALTTAKVLDGQGIEVKTLWVNKTLPAGQLSVDWDGRNKDGRTLTQGVFRIVLSLSRFELNPVGEFGGQGATPGRFLNPRGLCAFPQGARLTVAVADTGNNRVQLLTDQGGFLQSAGDFGAGQAALNQPTDVDWDGQILTVCDSQNRRLVLFDDRGNFLNQVVKMTGLQTSIGGMPLVLDFEDPERIRHDAGAFWVSDAGHGILFHVTNTGGVLDEIGAKFPLNNEGPFLAVGGDFWVETSKDQIQVIDSNGNSQAEIKPVPPFKDVEGLAASDKGFNLISDEGNGLVYFLDESGKAFQALSPTGASHPGALSLWEDQLFILDGEQNEVFHYQLAPEKTVELEKFIKIQTEVLPPPDANHGDPE